MLPFAKPVPRHDVHSDHSCNLIAVRITPGHFFPKGSGFPHFFPIRSNDLTGWWHRAHIATGRSRFAAFMAIRNPNRGSPQTQRSDAAKFDERAQPTRLNRAGKDTL
jgi:hypothetical protein